MPTPYTCIRTYAVSSWYICYLFPFIYIHVHVCTLYVTRIFFNLVELRVLVLLLGRFDSKLRSQGLCVRTIGTTGYGSRGSHNDEGRIYSTRSAMLHTTLYVDLPSINFVW